jgi:hypothetical protein
MGGIRCPRNERLRTWTAEFQGGRAEERRTLSSNWGGFRLFVRGRRCFERGSGRCTQALPASAGCASLNFFVWSPRPGAQNLLCENCLCRRTALCFGARNRIDPSRRAEDLLRNGCCAERLLRVNVFLDGQTQRSGSAFEEPANGKQEASGQEIQGASDGSDRSDRRRTLFARPKVIAFGCAAAGLSSRLLRLCTQPSMGISRVRQWATPCAGRLRLVCAWPALPHHLPDAAQQTQYTVVVGTSMESTCGGRAMTFIGYNYISKEARKRHPQFCRIKPSIMISKKPPDPYAVQAHHARLRTNPITLSGSVVVLRVEDPQDGKEEVDDVEIERDGRRNLLLHMVVAHDQLRVHQNVSGED